jgi:thiamine-phosphate pyrophosphorylase
VSRTRRWRHARLADARLYLCSGIRQEHGDLEEFLDAALGGGVDLVQLREKEAAPEQLREAAAVFLAAAERHDGLFIVNDVPELAAEVGADGVHVGQDDPAPEEAREVVGRERLVGRSTHDAEQIRRALREDCDYFAVGPVHATPTKQGRPGVGLGPVRLAAAVADRPWFVTGGMAAGTVGEVRAAGASRVVAVRAITEAADPRAAAAELAATLRGA